MPEISLKELDPRIQKQVQNADQSIARGNPNYAIDICAGILKQHPGCVDVRRILRKAQFKMSGSKGGTKMFTGVTNAPFMMKASSQVKKDPLAAIETAEKMLKVNPSNIPALRLLGQAADAAEFPQTAILAFESIKEVDGKNIDNLLALGEAYLKASQMDDAIRVGEAIMAIQPGHGGGSDLLRRASVSQSIEEGKWEDDDKDFRDKLKDEAQAVKLEQQARQVNDDDTLQVLIQDVYNKIQDEPDNVNNYKEIASHYRKLGDHENAIAWISHARTLPTGAADTTLEVLQSEIYIEQLEAGIKSYKDALEAEPDNQEYKAGLKSYEDYLDDYKMTIAKERVDKYPNDYQYRFEYGMLLYQNGNVDESIQQFQLSQRNPKVRQESLLRLGQAFKAGNKFDLAVDQLVTLIKELPIMDARKKEAIYELAGAYEKMDKEADAIEQYKELYQNDIGYRDVANKINDFYAKK